MKNKIILNLLLTLVFALIFILNANLAFSLTSNAGVGFSVGTCLAPIGYNGEWLDTVDHKCAANHFFCASTVIEGNGTLYNGLVDEDYENPLKDKAPDSMIYAGCEKTCCPENTVCVYANDSYVTEIGVIGKKCIERTIPCENYTEPEICEDNVCCWNGEECKDCTNIENCGDYETEDACLADLADVGGGSETDYCNGVDPNTGYWIDGCECRWNTTSSECYLHKNETDPNGEFLGGCDTYFYSGECNSETGLQLLTTKYIWSGGEEGEESCSCEETGCTEEMNCGGSYALLSFFTLTTLITTIIIIIIFYLVYLNIKKRKKIMKKAKKAKKR